MKKSLGAKTIIYPTPVLVIGSYDKNGKPNVMTAAWGGICCSSPPCLTCIVEKGHIYLCQHLRTEGFYNKCAFGKTY
jgi:flavin reductase (DIM6/NTAB) family NADH-FMN oxidoreductase RutF